MSGRNINILDDVQEGENYISNIQKNLDREDGYASDAVYSRNDNRGGQSGNVSVITKSVIDANRS